MVTKTGYESSNGFLPACSLRLAQSKTASPARGRRGGAPTPQSTAHPCGGRGDGRCGRPAQSWQRHCRDRAQAEPEQQEAESRRGEAGGAFRERRPLRDGARTRLIAGFNRGYNGFQQTYRTCTPAATLAIRRYIDEGLKISRDLTARYAN